MPTWEETKRNMQMAFLDAAKDVHSSIGSAYQQLLITGHLYALTGKESMTQQIVEGRFPELTEPELQPEKEPMFYLNHFHGHDPEQDQGLEPER